MKNIWLGISRSCASFPALRTPRDLPLGATVLSAPVDFTAGPFASGATFGLLTGMRRVSAGVRV